MTAHSGDASVQIADFGSAVKLQSASDTSNFRIGTPGYTAPEVIRGEDYGLSCDIWSVGVLMYGLLTNTLPFYSSDRSEMKRRTCTEPLDLDSNMFLRILSEPARDLLSGMLRKDPQERLTVEQVLAHQWFQ